MKTISTKNLSHDEWLELHRAHVGGSDSPVILLDTRHPHKNRKGLYLEKIGETSNTQETPAMMRGKYLEPIVAEIYGQKTDRKVESVDSIIFHPEFDFITGNIDREIIDEKKGLGILEIKCPGLKNFYKCKRDGVLDYYLIQLQHYLGITGAAWGALAIFNAENWDLIHFDIERDDELIDIIFREDAIFWDHVRHRVPPENTPGETIDLPPAMGGEIVRISSAEWAEAMRDLREARELKEELEQAEEAAKKRAQQIMEAAGAQVAEGAGARIYWKTQKGRRTLDEKALIRDFPTIDLNKYKKEGSPFRAFKPYFNVA